MQIWREEIFGPVLSVVTFKDADEALRLANSTEYGLAAAVMSKVYCLILFALSSKIFLSGRKTFLSLCKELD